MADPSGDGDGRSEWWDSLTPADKQFVAIWVQTEVRRVIFDLVPRLIDARLAARLGAGVADALLDLEPPTPPGGKHKAGKHVWRKTGTRARAGGRA